MGKVLTLPYLQRVTVCLPPETGPENCFGVRIIDNCLKECGIACGDIAVAAREDVFTGDLAVLRDTDSGYHIGYVYCEGGGLLIETSTAEVPDFFPMDEISTCGKVFHICRPRTHPSACKVSFLQSILPARGANSIRHRIYVP